MDGLPQRVGGLEAAVGRIELTLARIEERMAHLATKEELGTFRGEVLSFRGEVLTELATKPTRGAIWTIGIALAGLMFAVFLAALTLAPHLARMP